jgi:hypothetical protein
MAIHAQLPISAATRCVPAHRYHVIVRPMMIARHLKTETSATERSTAILVSYRICVQSTSIRLSSVHSLKDQEQSAWLDPVTLTAERAVLYLPTTDSCVTTMTNAHYRAHAPTVSALQARRSIATTAIPAPTIPVTPKADASTPQTVPPATMATFVQPVTRVVKANVWAE